MNMLCCESRCRCLFVSVIISVIIGIVAAFLQMSGIITVTSAFLWVLLGVAVVYLGLLVVASALRGFDDECSCLCSVISTLLLGIAATILLSIVLLAVTFEAGSVIGAIFVGLLLLSFSLIITASGCLVRCFLDCCD